MSDASTTATAATAGAPATTAAAPNIFQQIEADFEADVAAAVNWLKNGNANIASLLQKVATGAEVFVEDIIAGANFVGAHATVINSSLAGLSGVAAVVATSNPTVGAAAQKMLADLQTAANDTAAVSQALQTGNAAGQPGAVTTAVQAIQSVQSLAQLAAQASAALSTAVAASPAATQTATPPSPSSQA